jgi:ABC-type branched-subunit amino acid transport system substrate-binding protein
VRQPQRKNAERRAALNWLVLLAGLALLLAPGWGAWERASAQDRLTPQESRGKQIYVRGTSPSGDEVLAYLGESSLEVPGSAVACANCHGLDGQGRPEGGVNPSNLSWEVLTKPYGQTHADGRKHPPYSERALELAITRGTDPAGNKLLSVMPRYVMSREDMADLIFYLQHLGEDRDPGISKNEIVIGTAVPAEGAMADVGQAVKAVITAFFDEINSQGGIYSRHLELKCIETAETPAATRVNLERLLRDEQVFAMMSVFIAGSEKEVLPLLAQQDVPLIGPLTLYPQIGFPLNREVFYLLSGTDGLARVLIDFASKKPEFENLGVTIVYPTSEINAGVVEAIRDQRQKHGLSAPRMYDYVAGRFDAARAIKQLGKSSRDVLFFLGNSEEALSFMRAADQLGWFPSIFLPGPAGGTEIFYAPPGFNGKLFFSFPTSPADQSAEGINEFGALAEKYKLPSHHLATQMLAYSAAKILVEALKRAGRDLSRDKLIKSLEGIYEYPTGLTPALTFGPNRRIGAMGAYVVTIDLNEKQFLPASGWININ